VPPATSGGTANKVELMKLTQKVIELENEQEKTRVEMMGIQSNERMRREEMEAFFKTASQSYHEKI
jgi:hypothetical protein